MGVLAEYLRTEAQTIRAAKAKRQAAVKEWVDALNALFHQIEGWLKASDPDGLLDRAVEQVPGIDPALGEYLVPVLRISLGDRTVRIVPRARYVAATILPPNQEKPVPAHGLVEIRESIGSVYYLFQLLDGKWYIQSEAENLRVADNRVEPLDADRFDSAMWNLLR